MTEVESEFSKSDSGTRIPSSASPSPLANVSRGMMVNVIIPLALLLGGVAVVVLLGTVEPEKRADPDTTLVGRLRSLPPVRVAELQSLDATGRRLELGVDGEVVPFQEARVAAEVAGRVVFKAEACESGSYVMENQLLMRIDDTDYRLEVQRLTRLVEQEQQSIKESDQELVNTQRLIDVASRDVELQQREVDRLRSLPQGFASRAEVDRANRSLLGATQQLVTVENQYNLLNQRRIRLQASLKLAETQLRAADLNVERTNILAPIEGVIASEQADLNTFVPRGSTLVTIENTSKVEVASSLRMDQLYWVLDQTGQQVDLDARGYDLPNTPVIVEYVMGGREDLVYRWGGRLLSYDGIGLDPETRTVPVRVLVDQPRKYVDEQGASIEVKSAPALVRGMYVRVRLLLRPRTSLVVIPANALQPGNRVLQFVPDDSVLRPEASEDPAIDSGLAVQPVQDSASPGPADELPGFDPLQWEPGRVVIRKSIYPVDALRLGKSETTQSGIDMTDQGRLWVCEVAGEELEGGSYVIVSAMGDLDESEVIAVRADRSGMAEPREESRAMAPTERQSTATDSTPSVEDA